MISTNNKMPSKKTWLVFGFFMVMTSYLSLQNDMLQFYTNGVDETYLMSLYKVFGFIKIVAPLIILPLLGCLYDKFSNASKLMNSLTITTVTLLFIYVLRLGIHHLQLPLPLLSAVFMAVIVVLSTFISTLSLLLVIAYIPRQRWFAYYLILGLGTYLIIMCQTIIGIIMMQFTTTAYVLNSTLPLILLYTALIMLRKHLIHITPYPVNSQGTSDKSTKVSHLTLYLIISLIILGLGFSGKVFSNYYYGNYYYNNVDNNTLIITLNFYLNNLIGILAILIGSYLLIRRGIKEINLVKGSLIIILLLLGLYPMVYNYLPVVLTSYYLDMGCRFLIYPVIYFLSASYITKSRTKRPTTCITIVLAITGLISDLMSNVGRSYTIFSTIDLWIEKLGTYIVLIPLSLLALSFLLLHTKAIRALFMEDDCAM